MNRLLLLTSIALFITGIVFITLLEKWYVFSIILLVIGFICFANWLIIRLKNANLPLQQQNKIIAIKIFFNTVAILAIVVFINVFFIEHSLRIDLTENQIFTLAPQSKEIATNLTQPLKVWILNRNIDPETQTLLENYRRYSSNFSYKLIEPNSKPSFTQQFEAKYIGETYLEYDGKKQLLNTSVTPLGVNISENNLANAIAKIQQNSISYIYFLQGHGEPTVKEEKFTESELSQAIDKLKESYVVKPLNLTTGKKIPQNADLITIAKPIKKLLDTEVTQLQQYLENGGNLLIMLMPHIDIGLNTIWQNWGIELDNRLLIDGSAIEKRSPTVVTVDSYGDHPITDNFDNGVTLFPESRIIKIIKKDNITATPLVITNNRTWAESNLAQDKITFNPQEDIRGSLNIAIVLTKENLSRMVIFGNGNFATDEWFDLQLNSNLFLNTVKWLTETNQEMLSISPRELTNRRINLSPLQSRVIEWLAIKIFPSLSFILAAIFWWKKR